MSVSQKLANILVVDDVESIRLMICEYLSREFNVHKAQDAKQALDICRKQEIDLVITDIKMPGMSGVELICILRESYPNMQYALMTAYNVDDFITLAREKGICNIIPKSIFLNIHHILILARKLLDKNPFGIGHYFPKANIEKLQLANFYSMYKNLSEHKLKKDTYYMCSITNKNENRNMSEKVGQLLINNGSHPCVQQVLEELCGNAIKHTKDGRGFELCFGMLNEYTVIGVIDYSGGLDYKQILLHLERQVTIDEKSGLPIGVEDSHGRGLYISREQCEHLIFNIDPDKKTEIIGILSLEPVQRSRAVSIFQL